RSNRRADYGTMYFQKESRNSHILITFCCQVTGALRSLPPRRRIVWVPGAALTIPQCSVDSFRYLSIHHQLALSFLPHQEVFLSKHRSLPAVSFSPSVIAPAESVRQSQGFRRRWIL